MHMVTEFYKDKTHYILLANSLGLMWPCLSSFADSWAFRRTIHWSIQQNQTPLTGAGLKNASLRFM